MINIDKIRPIPKYMLAKIRKVDLCNYKEQNGYTRYYAYLTKIENKLVKITVAVRNKKNKWYCKQVAVHGLHEAKCWVKDMSYSCIGGYVTGWHEQGLTTTQKWYEGGWGYTDDKYFDVGYTLINREYIDSFPEYKYSAYQLYQGVDIMKYLRTYEEYPQVEFLMKMGLCYYALRLMILKKVGKDKSFRKWLWRNKEVLSERYYNVSAIIKAYKTNGDIKLIQKRDEEMKSLIADRDAAPIRQLFKNNLAAYLNYRTQQNITNRLYLDYLNACNELGLDMSIDKNKIPHDFQHWHDVRIDEYATKKAEKDAKERAALYEQFAKIAEKYIPLQYNKKNDFIVIIAKCPMDLIREGEKLHHCVGHMGYDQKFIREDSLIFFVRTKETPDKPMATIEYSPSKHKILQCHGDHNIRPDDTVMNYINKIWLPYANRAVKRIAA